MEDEKKTPSTAIDKLNAKIEKLQESLVHAKMEIETLSSTNKTLEKENKEYYEFKSEVEGKASFKKLGGKDDYYKSYERLKDELGEKPTPKQISAFKEKYSIFFEESKVPEGSPTSAIAGSDVAFTEDKGDPNELKIDEGDTKSPAFYTD